LTCRGARAAPCRRREQRAAPRRASTSESESHGTDSSDDAGSLFTAVRAAAANPNRTPLRRARRRKARGGLIHPAGFSVLSSAERRLLDAKRV
jgi:hypothetical protein